VSASQLRVGIFAALVAGLALATSAEATFHIASLYSNQNGSAQAIELTDDSSGELKFAPLGGSTITVRYGDVVKRYAFPTDVPAGFPYGGTLLVSSDLIMGDFVMPELFLPTNGGTIDLDGQDPWTFPPLPTDGTTKLLRSGGTALAFVQSFASGDLFLTFEWTDVIEYYAPVLDHYFMSASEPDIDALESGRIPGWVATGYELPGLSVPVPTYCCSSYGQTAVPVCRFYIPPPEGPSHFFSAFAAECDAIPAKFPSLVLETAAAFYVYLPSADTGACPYPFRPVYRVWDQRADTNHRYVYNDLKLRQQMLAQGWVPEGLGPLGVAWCS
jgi:hypothetical protein